MPLSGAEDEEDEVKVEFGRMGASHLYSINPSHIINAISDQPNFATAPAPVRPVPATAWLFPLRLSHLRRPVLSAPSPHSPAFRQMCTQSALYRYPSWFNEKLFNHRDTTSPSSSPRTSFAFVRQRVCPDSPLRQCLLVFDQCSYPKPVPFLAFSQNIASNTTTVLYLLRVTKSLPPFPSLNPYIRTRHGPLKSRATSNYGSSHLHRISDGRRGINPIRIHQKYPPCTAPFILRLSFVANPPRLWSHDNLPTGEPLVQGCVTAARTTSKEFHDRRVF